MGDIKLNCSNCGASLEVDIDNYQTYCPYCGQKLLIDFDHLGEVIGEKEETKRTAIREGEETKRVQIKEEYAERKDKREKADDWKLLWFGIGIYALLIAFCLFMSHAEDIKHSRNKEIEVPFSYEEVEEEQYDDVVRRFESLGFTNIKLAPDEDVKLGIFVKEGAVETVSIAGDTAFEDGDWFAKDSIIVITYHARKNKSE